MNKVILDLESVKLTDEQFFQLCLKNRDFRFERDVTGELIIMAPAGSETSNRNIEVAYQLQAWSRSNNLGIAFDSSGGFKLPNGANRSPDAAWIKLESWQGLTAEQKTRFAPICPDFVIELRSPSDSLKNLQKKMAEYMANGTRLGLLIDRKNRQVEVYRRGEKEAEVFNNPATISGEDVLPGFILDLTKIW